MSDEVAKWIVGLVAAGGIGALTMFIKSLVDRINNSVSRTEFYRVIQEIKDSQESMRKELRENQISLFNKIDIQQSTLSGVVAKLDLLTSMRPFDQTFPGRQK